MNILRISGILIGSLVLAAKLYATPQSPDPVLGKWIWQKGSTAIFRTDGICEIEDPPLKGTWKFLDNPELERQYAVNWDQGRYLNTLILSRDGKSAVVHSVTHKRNVFTVSKSADLAPAPITEVATNQFSATSFKTGFTVVGKIDGSYSHLPAAIDVNIKEGFLRIANPKKHEGNQFIVKSVRALLVHYLKDGIHFGTVSSSEDLVINQAIPSQISLPSSKFKIPTNGISYAELKKTWIAFEISIGTHLTGERVIGFCYIHTPCYLFSHTSTGFPYRF